MLIRRAGLCLFAAAMLTMSCGDDHTNHGWYDDTYGDDGGVEPGACLTPSGTTGAATIHAGTAREIMAVSTTAQNQLDNHHSPLPAVRMGALARGTGDCAAVGIVYMDPAVDGLTSARLMYDLAGVDGIIEPFTPEVVVDGLIPITHNASLFYDLACNAVVMRPVSTGYMEYDRSDAGVWSGLTIDVAPGTLVSGLSPIGAWQEPDGTMVVLARAAIDGVTRAVEGRRAASPAGTWTFSAFDFPQYTELFAMRTAADGTSHAVYTKTEYPCDPCDMDLYYGHMTPEGVWTEETIQESKWGDPDDEYATDATMVLDENGQPVIAATFMKRVVTGSIKSAEVRVYGGVGGVGDPDGDWCSQRVAAENDGYQGSDGSDMTGVSPFVAIDGSGRIHMVFQDMAQWHDASNYANAVYGQIRYAVRSGSKWTVSTLYAQDGQTVSSRPLYGMLPTSMVVSPDGGTVHVAGASLEWDTDSIYMSTAAPITFRALIQKSTVELP